MSTLLDMIRGANYIQNLKEYCCPGVARQACGEAPHGRRMDKEDQVHAPTDAAIGAKAVRKKRTGTLKRRSSGNNDSFVDRDRRGHASQGLSVYSADDAGQQKFCDCSFFLQWLGFNVQSAPPTRRPMTPPRRLSATAASPPSDGGVTTGSDVTPPTASRRRNRTSEKQKNTTHKRLETLASLTPPRPEPPSPSSSIVGALDAPFESPVLSPADAGTCVTSLLAPETLRGNAVAQVPRKVLLDNFKVVFAEGQKVIIHSKEVNPRKAMLFIEDEAVCWNFISAYYAFKGLRKISLSEVVEINPGKTGEAFQRRMAEGAPEKHCVTIVSKDKALAIEFSNQVVQEAFSEALSYQIEVNKESRSEGL